MATIRQVGQKWHAQVRKQGYPQQTRSFTRKAAAEKWARKVETQIEEGLFLDIKEAQTTSLAKLLDRYQREILPTKKSQRAVKYQIKLIKKELGHLMLAAVTPAKLATFRDNRLQHVSTETARKDLLLLSRVFNTALTDWGIHLPHGNPLKKVRLPSSPPGRERRLKDGEEEKLLDALRRTPQVKAIVQLALETGMRRSELVNMQWADIDLRGRVLRIGDTKTGTPRTIPLSSKAVSVLKGLPRRLDGKVCDLQPDSVTQAFDRACRRDGIPDLHFHDLRHEATSRFFEKGFNPMEVATITGHKDLRMLRRYTHLRAQDLLQRLG